MYVHVTGTLMSIAFSRDEVSYGRRSVPSVTSVPPTCDVCAYDDARCVTFAGRTASNSAVQSDGARARRYEDGMGADPLVQAGNGRLMSKEAMIAPSARRVRNLIHASFRQRGTANRKRCVMCGQGFIVNLAKTLKRRGVARGNGTPPNKEPGFSDRAPRCPHGRRRRFLRDRSEVVRVPIRAIRFPSAAPVESAVMKWIPP
jgi:hypothetical protein